MADNSAIEWTDATWNPVTGCSVVSPGCTNCYAMKLAGTRLRHIPSRAGLTIDTKAGPVWNGEARLNEQWLDQPFKWKRPRRIFVCAHGDLFAENVPDGWIMAVFDVMWRTPWHSYQVLTKRSARLRSFIEKWCDLSGEDFADFKDARGPNAVRKAHPSGRAKLFADYLDVLLQRSGGKVPDGAAWPTFDWMQGMMRWPNVAPNVWLGVSAEDQTRADLRIPDLLATPAAVRFVSAEPLIGPIDFEQAWHGENALESECWGQCAWCDKGHPPLHNCHRGKGDWEKGRSGLDWIIVGGESGRDARPMHPAWARAIRDQCAAAGVPFFFKQWGEHRPLTNAEHGQACGATLIGSDPHDRDAYLLRVGKNRAGRLLDGVEHNGFPAMREVPFG